VQGLFSGPLIPISQSVLVDAYPASQRTRVMSFWAMGVMGGPAVGPMIGGYLAQNLDWRWNFYVNLPLGVLALVMVARFFPKQTPRPERVDVVGFGLLFAFIVALQILLDQGDTLDWRGSRTIVLLGVVALTAGFAFVARALVVGDRNVIKLRLLADRNFATCALQISLIGMSMLGFLVLAPAFLVDTLGWEEVTAGVVIGGAGAAGLLGAAISGRLTPVVGVKPLIVAGALLTSAGWLAFSRMNLDVSPLQVILPGVAILVGIQLGYAPIAAQAFLRVPDADRDEAAGLFNFVKTLGFSFGTTLVSVLVYRGAQRDWNQAVGFLDPAARGYDRFFHGMGLDPTDPRAVAVASHVLQQEPMMVTIVKSAEVMAILALLAIPLCLLLARAPKGAGSAIDLAAAAG
jgi:DHA2 family multidrug resistance protein